MAVRNLARASKNHAGHFAESLSKSQRNSLRAILLHESGVPDLRNALGIAKARIVPEHERRTGLARAGRTAELFEQHRVAVNVVVID